MHSKLQGFMKALAGVDPVVCANDSVLLFNAYFTIDVFN
jgi:hypothetical protein